MTRQSNLNNDTISFADWLVETRSARGWSQEETAVGAGVTQAFISSLERSSRAPSREVVRKLAQSLYAGDGGDTESFERFADRALISAGFAPSSKSFSEALDLAERYHNLPLRDRRLIQQILETADEGENRSA